ncbi:hypothetical protein MKW94_006030 [Papaver nudicaule]|uniref:LOB domain-containing protein n=1 Tax=Papaver nudicaule TaxID=74823 RepID=A0AA42APE1_PAPNU|nr:hypothetical protein [Papaver nudicaule]
MIIDLVHRVNTIRKDAQSSKCSLAPIFPPNRSEDFKAISRVFGADRFRKLVKSTEPHQQNDPVRGLEGTMHNLSGKLDDLHTEVVNMKMQNELILWRNTLQNKHVVYVPSTLLQQLGSFSLIPAVPSHIKSCAECKQFKRKCPPECPLAPFFFFLAQKGGFPESRKSFRYSYIKKWMKSANGQIHLAAQSIIIRPNSSITWMHAKELTVN